VSLRRRLLLGILLMSAFGLIGVSLATNQLLRRSLINQKDSQLRSLSAQVLDERGRGRRPPPGGSVDTANPQGPTGWFQAQYAPDGILVSGGRSEADAGGGLDPEFDVMTAKQDVPFTESALLGGGAYRVIVRAFNRPISLNGELVLYVVSGIEVNDVDHTVSHLAQLEAIVIGIGLALMGLLTWLVVRAGLRPLNHMADTAAAIAAGDLSARVDSADQGNEVGRLGSALNTMLARIEAAFAERTRSEDKLRRFVADASHELRTPLTSIRGYSELLRAGAIPAGEETTSALGRIESEATRMGVLVDDLLLLARLDQGRPLEHHPLDLADLVSDAVDDARASAPDRVWSVSLPDHAPVVGDEHRLRQVVGNLLTNARVHTPAGTPIEVVVAEVDCQIELVVADHGAGVPDGEDKRIFERFARLDGSRQRASGGTGLGLAIVSAIVWSHGGTVGIRPTVGGGASFWLRLPMVGSGSGLSAPTPWPAPDVD
jgi:two-component system, OmpR family, sensor kinase